MGESAEPAPEVLEAFAAFSRSLKRIALYRHQRDKHASYLEPALSSLSAILDREAVLTVTVEPGALSVGGAPVYTELAREDSLCFRLHRDGVRTISFSRGLSLGELLTFTEAALPDERRAGREDAVTELWKADLINVSYTAAAGYRMEQGDDDRERVLSAVGEVALRTAQTLQQFAEGIAHEDELSYRTLPPMLGHGELRDLDPAAPGPLARRSIRTLLDIVERGYASRDLAVLCETLSRLVAELVDRRDEVGLEAALKGALELKGKQADELRKLLGAKLADLARLTQLLDAAQQYPVVNVKVAPHWIALLPGDAGGALLDVLEAQVKPANRLLVAKAAAERLESCRALFEAKLRFSPTDISRALLIALRGLPPHEAALVAVPALLHGSSAVRRDALAVVAGDPESALVSLRPILGHEDAELRVAAAEVLGRSPRAEEATEVLLEAMQQASFQRREGDEQAAFHRALGRLHSDTGHRYLVMRLAPARRSIFALRRTDTQRLFAVQGLTADGTQRSLDALELMAGGKDEVADACRLAAKRVKQGLGQS